MIRSGRSVDGVRLLDMPLHGVSFSIPARTHFSFLSSDVEFLIEKLWNAVGVIAWDASGYPQFQV